MAQIILCVPILFTDSFGRENCYPKTPWNRIKPNFQTNEETQSALWNQLSKSWMKLPDVWSNCVNSLSRTACFEKSINKCNQSHPNIPLCICPHLHPARLVWYDAAKRFSRPESVPYSPGSIPPRNRVPGIELRRFLLRFPAFPNLNHRYRQTGSSDRQQ